MPNVKKLLAVLSVILIGTIKIGVYAEDMIDRMKTGSIHITMHQGDTAVGNGRLALFQVGEIDGNEGNYRFVLTDEFSESNVSLDDVYSPDTAWSLFEYAEGHDVEKTVKEIDENGNIAFEQLMPGLYLLIQEESAIGYKKIDPFLVSVPMIENGKIVYDIDASPKVEVENETENPPKEEDEPDHELPLTGQLNWPILVMTASGLGLVSLGWIIRSKENEEIEQ